MNADSLLLGDDVIGIANGFRTRVSAAQVGFSVGGDSGASCCPWAALVESGLADVRRVEMASYGVLSTALFGTATRAPAEDCLVITTVPTTEARAARLLGVGAGGCASLEDVYRTASTSKASATSMPGTMLKIERPACTEGDGSCGATGCETYGGGVEIESLSSTCDLLMSAVLCGGTEDS